MWVAAGPVGGTFASGTMTTIADTNLPGALASPCHGPARRVRVVVDPDRGAAAARRRNDQVLLTRQARLIAEQAALIGSLERRIDRLAATPPAPAPAAPAAPSAACEPRKVIAVEASSSATNVTVERTTVLPTVYTNLGSLMDVFA